MEIWGGSTSYLHSTTQYNLNSPSSAGAEDSGQWDNRPGPLPAGPLENAHGGPVRSALSDSRAKFTGSSLRSVFPPSRPGGVETHSV